MGLDKLGMLYRQVLLEHANRPRNFGTLADYTKQVELLNPTCGDAIVVQYLLENHRITQVGFTGHGCSISMASASMMTEALKGKATQQAEALIQAFNALVGGDGDAIDLTPELEEQLKDAVLLEGVKQFPARYKCAILAWKAMEMGIKQEQTELLDGLTLKSASVESE